jgi:low affinity Fe/Cu permease
VASSSDLSRSFAKVASRIAHAAGSPGTFVISCAIVILWAISGPAFGYSDTWQLIINTGTTVITFLIVFLIQIPRIGTARLCRQNLMSSST